MTKKIDRATPARLIVVDDHDHVRESMMDMLSGEPDLLVVGEAVNGLEGLELCRRVLPDLVLMDVRMPRMDGLAATRKIKQEHPETSVLMVTMNENPDYLFEALRAGAAGYVLKDATQDELANAIRGVLSGESPLDPRLSARLLRRLAEEARTPAAEARPERRQTQLPQPLTSREREVLEMLSMGKTNREIAESFVISTGTVKRHVENLIAKLGVSDRTQAVVRALELGIILFPNSN